MYNVSMNKYNFFGDHFITENQTLCTHIYNSDICTIIHTQL